ncbi:ATP-binding protein [Desulfopila sp. IMCC35006]|uniref:ATP-binding protein n=1 Tax=Desulfopila sp. IMCC35006 TaxID=2569542 RepID=UPI0010AD4612|nr:ATP-binding protein [Desulfopila sp. IMCC35006]TKB26487.1 ATP-binding protein [Desulfopila sp. IMCC35006]
MAKDLWLPKGYELTDGSKIRSLLFSGDGWQIFDTNGSDNILLARRDLVEKWSESDFLSASLFGEITFGAASFRSLSSHKKYALAPVESGKSPDSKVDAIAFSFALKESRKLSTDASFHDSIYIEQYSRLLPTWTLTPHVEDEVVLGTWITGGVVVSTESFRRLTTLTGWMPAGDLAEIVKAAGFHVPADAGLLTKRKPASQLKTGEKTTVANVSVEPEQPQSQGNFVTPKVFSLPGRPQIEEFFNEHIIDIIFNAEKYQAMGIEFPSAIVLHGPPGCGKTFAVERLVDFIDWPSYSIDSNSVGSPYIHETSKKISEVFDKAIDGAPAVIVIDEMESFLSDRRSGGTSSLHHVEEVAEFLRRIPEAIKNKVLIIAMTNLIEMIDPAILRRGRFDHIIEVGMPSRIEVASLLDSLLSKLPKAEDLNINTILDALTGKALSDSAFVIREAARLAAKAGKSQLDQESIDAALKSLPEDKEKKSRRIGF